jgi:hypothetical protein
MTKRLTITQKQANRRKCRAAAAKTRAELGVAKPLKLHILTNDDATQKRSKILDAVLLTRMAERLAEIRGAS